MENIAPKKKRRIRFWAITVIFVVVIYVLWVTTRALPQVQPITTSHDLSSTSLAGSLSWPSYGQSAVGINNLGVVATHGSQQPIAMASTAKLITALSVLNKKPLSLSQQGPMISLSANDVAIYNQYVAKEGSVVRVVDGEQISEYQMLQAMLLPSGDNIADSLADWTFGSLANYSSYANSYLKTAGLASSRVGVDASGLDPSSTTTASDLVSLGEIAMANPIIAQIVGQTKADNIPVVGTIDNVNSLLGYDNITGIKTGNTDQAGGVFLSSSKIIVNNQPVTIYTAVMDAPNLWQAMHSSAGLVASAQANFATPASLAAIKQGDKVGGYILPWDKHLISVYSSDTVANEAWNGSKVTAKIVLDPVNFNDRSGQVVGYIMTNNSLLNYSTHTPVIIKTAISKPSNWWLILHPGYVL